MRTRVKIQTTAMRRKTKERGDKPNLAKRFAKRLEWLDSARTAIFDSVGPVSEENKILRGLRCLNLEMRQALSLKNEKDR